MRSQKNVNGEDFDGKKHKNWSSFGNDGLTSTGDGWLFCRKASSPRRATRGGKHYADILATKGEESIVVSLKWQQSSGTAEQKVLYEYMCLANTVNLHEDVSRGYIVIGGDGWTKHNFFLGELKNWVNNDANIQVLRLDSFVAKANQGLL